VAAVQAFVFDTPAGILRLAKSRIAQLFFVLIIVKL
jgi:hypothetical protein